MQVTWFSVKRYDLTYSFLVNFRFLLVVAGSPGATPGALVEAALPVAAF